MAKLTERQKMFCEKYIETLNATESAIYAGYSKKTARQSGYENLTKDYIQKYIQKALNERKSDLIASQEEILETYTSILRNKNENTSDRLKALDSLGKTYAMFTNVNLNEVTVNNGKLNDLLNELEE